MTEKQIIQRLKEIKDALPDKEEAHGLEDTLHQDVLRAIARGSKNSKVLAQAALKSLDITFARWCA